MARQPGGVQRHCASTAGRNFQPHPRTAPAGPIQRPGRGPGRQQNAARPGCGETAEWKRQKANFPTPLGNPAKGAGFPLSYSPDELTLLQEPKDGLRALARCRSLTDHRGCPDCRLEVLRRAEWLNAGLAAVAAIEAASDVARSTRLRRRATMGLRLRLSPRPKAPRAGKAN